MSHAEPYIDGEWSSPEGWDTLEKMARIINTMSQSGVPDEVLQTLYHLLVRRNKQDPGLKDLLEMWEEEKNPQERDEILADIEELLEDIENAPKRPEKKPYIRFDDLEEIKKDIRGFKDQLRDLVDRHGGIGELSKKTGMSQPSLSRFFSSNSMPRRTTLYRIANALELSEKEVSFRWVR